MRVITVYTVIDTSIYIYIKLVTLFTRSVAMITCSEFNTRRVVGHLSNFRHGNGIGEGNGNLNFTPREKYLLII